MAADAVAVAATHLAEDAPTQEDEGAVEEHRQQKEDSSQLVRENVTTATSRAISPKIAPRQKSNIAARRRIDSDGIP